VQQPGELAVSHAADAEDGRRIIAKVIRRLIPFIFLCYVVAYVDRVNIGFAANAMQRDLGLSDSAYGIGAGLFFFGYFLFEVPSNLILERVGARRWIARIMVTWGIVSMAMVFVQGTWSFYGMRVLLGLAEAGFFPGIVLYLTYWIPKSERARTGALFMTAAPVSIIIGAPVSESLLGLDGMLGMHGWQWLFLLEGLPAVVLGVLALRLLTDRPEKADWLTDGERAWLASELAREHAEKAPHAHLHGIRGLTSGRVWLLALIYFLNTLVTYGLFLWLPKILRDVSGYDGFTLAAITAIPFVFALVGMVMIGAHSDRTGERKWHVAGCALTGALGLILAASSQHSVALIVLSFALCQVGQRSVMSVFWSIPPIFLGGTAAAAGIGMINAVGNLGGFVGPTVMGWLRTTTNSYSVGLLVLAGSLIIAAALVATLHLPAPVPKNNARAA
jgi:ACS family tartrate transporter-like MFS transporter